MTSLREPTEMADIVIRIYKSAFRGKEKGRFALTREQIKAISGRKSMQDEVIIAGLSRELLEQGYCMTDVDGGGLFAIVNQSVLARYRRPPKKLLSEILAEYE